MKKTILKTLTFFFIISCNDYHSKKEKINIISTDEIIPQNNNTDTLDLIQKKVIEDFDIFENATLKNDVDVAYKYLHPIMFDYIQSTVPEEDFSSVKLRKKILKQIYGQMEDIQSDGYKFDFQVNKISRKLTFENYDIYKISYLTKMQKDDLKSESIGKIIAIKEIDELNHWRFAEYNDDNIDSILTFILPKSIIQQFNNL